LNWESEDSLYFHLLELFWGGPSLEDATEVLTKVKAVYSLRMKKDGLMDWASGPSFRPPERQEEASRVDREVFARDANWQLLEIGDWAVEYS
jgi:hypothetical protein